MTWDPLKSDVDVVLSEEFVNVLGECADVLVCFCCDVR